jgi:hypothetical protein
MKGPADHSHLSGLLPPPPLPPADDDDEKEEKDCHNNADILAQLAWRRSFAQRCVSPWFCRSTETGAVTHVNQSIDPPPPRPPDAATKIDGPTTSAIPIGGPTAIRPLANVVNNVTTKMAGPQHRPLVAQTLCDHRRHR